MCLYNFVRPLPVPELLVKSDSIYRATLWLRNPGHSRRLHNQPCRVLMILDHDVTGHVHCMLLQIDFLLYPRVTQVFWIFPLQQQFYLLPTVTYVITLFVFVTTYVTYSTQPLQTHLFSQWFLQFCCSDSSNERVSNNVFTHPNKPFSQVKESQRTR